MNWITFANRIKSDNLIYFDQNQDTHIFALCLRLGCAIYEFGTGQNKEALAQCMANATLLGDYFKLDFPEINREIYGNVAYLFVNHDRIRTNYHGFIGVIIRAHSNRHSISKKLLQPHFSGLMTSFVDCSYAYGWIPEKVMEDYFEN